MTARSPSTEASRRIVEELTKAGERILAQRGVYGGARPAALAWLLSFLQDDLSAYSFGEWADRWAEVNRFCVDGGLGADEVPLSNQEGVSLTLPGRFASPFTATRSFPGPGEKDAIIALQQVMKGDIDSYVDRGSATTFDLIIKLRAEKGAPRVMVESRDLTISFQFQAFHLIAEIGARIRRCRRCQRLFLAGRSDKEFCSGNCQALQYKREHPLKKTKTKLKRKQTKKGKTHGTRKVATQH